MVFETLFSWSCTFNSDTVLEQLVLDTTAVILPADSSPHFIFIDEVPLPSNRKKHLRLNAFLNG